MSALTWHRHVAGVYDTNAYAHSGAKLPRLYRARKDAHHSSLWVLEGRVPGIIDHWVLVNYHDSLREAKAAAEAHLDTYPEEHTA